jgi:Autotransporter beta-domain
MSMHTNAFGTLLVSIVAWQPAPVKAQVIPLGETVRHTSESITRRITQSALREAEDREPEELINGWVSPSYTNIHSDSDFNDDGIDIDTDVDTDIYQVVGGADKRLGSFYVGASAGYARGETHVSTRESFDGFVFDDEFDVGTHNPSFSPYAAYHIDENFFLTAIAGYSRAQIDDSPSDADSAFTDLSVTGLLAVNQWVVTGRFGHRFAYSVFDDLPSFVDDDSFENTLYVTGEVGYRIDRWLPHFRANYEHIIPEEGDDADFVFVGVGASYDFSDVFSAGLAYNTELNHLDDFNYNRAVLDIRLRF